MSVPEDIGVGSEVIQVTAVDPDAGSNSDVRYVISSSDETTSSSWFAVTQHSGIVRLIKSLDRELLSEMQFHVSFIAYSSTYKYS